MISVYSVFFLITQCPPADVLSGCVSLTLLCGFFSLVRHIFSAENLDYYREESLIPLQDDTEEEKHLFAQPDWHPPRQGRLDA